MARPKIAWRNLPPKGEAQGIKINEDATALKDKATKLPHLLEKEKPKDNTNF